MDKKKGLRERSGQEGGSSRKSRKVKNLFSSRSFAYSAHTAKVLLRVEQDNDRLRNFALSPLSIDVVLHMLAAGLKGNALEQMLTFLGSKNMDEILSESRDMMRVLDNLMLRKGENDLCMVNGMWIDEDCSLPNKSNYITEVLEKIFNCNVKSNVDFLKEAIKVTKDINSWVERESKELIKKLVPDGVINEETGVVFVNALYFKGMWDSEHIFDGQTVERDFHLLNRETVKASFMTSSKKYHCKSFSDFKVLKIPYQEGELGKFSMFFFLPDGRSALPNLLEKLSLSDSPHEDYFDLKEVKFRELWIPKFDIQYDFDVPATMKKKGIVFPSMENSEDFSEMVIIRPGDPNFATNMFQKVVIKIDEKGTEAATATSFGFPRGPRYDRMSFVADHPFMFMIKEENSGLIFFMGSVLNPSL